MDPAHITCMNPVKKVISVLATTAVLGAGVAGFQAFTAEPDAPVTERVTAAGVAAATSQVEAKRAQRNKSAKLTAKAVKSKKARKLAKSKQAKKARKVALREAKKKAAEVDLSATTQRFSPEQSQSITQAFTAVVETGKSNFAGVDKAVTKTLGDHLPYVLTQAARLGNPDALLALAEMARDGIKQAAKFLASLGVDPSEHVR